MDILLGFIIDYVLGDPHNLPHPIRWIGKMISWLEKKLNRDKDSNGKKFIKGMMLAVIVCSLSFVVSYLILHYLYAISFAVGIIVEGIMCYYLIAPKCLKKESMKVRNELVKDDIEGARRAVSMIVGRDTKNLDEEGIAKAAVETVAENTSDGVTAPLMCMAIGGAPLAFLYKAVNTMDSMIGYKNDKYMFFGRFAAKLDDVLNFIPSRITAIVMILSSYIMGYDGDMAVKIWKRDRRKHASPNSAQTEAVVAGALGIELAGDAYYFGKLHKKDTIGDKTRDIEIDDICRVNDIMYMTSTIVLVFCVIIRVLLISAIRKM